MPSRQGRYNRKATKFDSSICRSLFLLPASGLLAGCKSDDTEQLHAIGALRGTISSEGTHVGHSVQSRRSTVTILSPISSSLSHRGVFSQSPDCNSPEFRWDEVRPPKIRQHLSSQWKPRYDSENGSEHQLDPTYCLGGFHIDGIKAVYSRLDRELVSPSGK
jgi:hypothetical protein